MASLFIVATPIGNLDDISRRAVQTLKEVALIAAEDTRHTRKLCDNFQIDTPLLALHEHNEDAAVDKLIQRLQAGEDIALVSDAGTPLLSDPGYHLVRAAVANGIQVVPIPGACAVIAALCAAGVATDCFYFAGFLPAKGSSRREKLKQLQARAETLVLYEAPHRIEQLLQELAENFPAERELVLARELTKRFEQFVRGTVASLKTWANDSPEQVRGEFVVILGPAPASEPAAEQYKQALELVRLLQQELPLRKAAKIAAQITGLGANELYDLGLK